MSRGGAAAPSVLERLLRPGRNSSRDVLLDVAGIVALALLLMATGLGLRDPWPADEPRFALIARDMLRSGEWLIPRVGGDLYADKPPLYFWLMAAAMAATGSLRAGFLLPSLLAGVGTVLLVYDLLRRARGREIALAGALLLLLTFQFTWQARQAQIDAVLCFLTTLSLYGLLRHLLLGPAPGWFIAGWAAAGLGVITKGVGFLPLLALLPFAGLARRGWPAPVVSFAALVPAGLAALLVAVGLWFVPMVIATAPGGDLGAYRDEILLEQTVTRYAGAWHHHEPPWHYLTQVIPVLWLPLIALVPWLWPRWRAALGGRDTLVAVLLAWVVIVLVFFSASPGKRGVYVLPALPALAMAAAPWLPDLLRARGTRRLALALALVLVGVAAVGAGYFAIDAAAASRVQRDYGLQPLVPLAVTAIASGALVAWLGLRDGWLAFAGVLATALVAIGLLINPRMDSIRSGRAFIEQLDLAARDVDELGIVGFREQHLLHLRRPSVNFGHARWRERASEAADAAAWLAARPGRALLMEQEVRDQCFGSARAVELGRANRVNWSLVSGPPDVECVARGDPTRAISYFPPDDHLNTGG